jgi:serine-aspartate repeat-containing protein C/D/E
VGLMSIIAPWRKWRRDSVSRMAGGQGPHGATTELMRICRFERVEPRCLMAADLQLGVVYHDKASGDDSVANTFTVSWSGGAPGTELKQLTITTDSKGNPTVQIGDPFFDTAPGLPGVYGWAPLSIVSHNGFSVTGQNPALGSTQLVLNFSDFTPGKQLVFTIDVDDLDTLGANATVNGKEFEGSQVIGTFSAPHYQDDTMNATFYDVYQGALDASGLSLPPDSYVGGLVGGTVVNTIPTPVYTAGAFAENQQTPLPITLEGTVYYDPDLNNIQEAGEPGIQNVQLSLLAYNGSAYVPTGVTTNTDANGHYKFTGVLPGDYRIVETQPSGYFAVGSSTGNISGVGDGVVTDAHTLSKIVVLGGEDVVHNDFSQALPNSISGHVRVEDGKDCETDPTVPPLAGVTIQLLNSKGAILSVTTTDANGFYQFTNLAPGTYAVQKLTPAGYFDVDDHVGSAGGSLLDLNNIGGVTLTSNIQGVNYDFCEDDPVTISGYVKVEKNDNWDTDPASPPVPNVTVNLIDAQGKVLATAITGENGFYSFTGLAPGTYGVVKLPPAGYFDGHDVVGSNGGTLVGPDKITGANLTVGGTHGTRYDFSELLPVSINGYVHVDVNGDCDTDPNAPPLAGVTIQLLDAQGNTLGTTTTDANGFYQFQALHPGVYGTREIVPNGYFAEDNHVGSAGGTLNGLTEVDGATLTSGETGTHYDYCLALPVSISGYVHINVNGDCDTDPNAPPLAGVTIQLLDAQGKVLASTTTDDKGFYVFQGLHPGVYGTREIVPVGYFADDDHVGSAGGTLNGLTEVDGATLTSGLAGTHYDYCLNLPVSISGYVHVDVKGDCDTDPNAPPLAGVTIQLLDAQRNVIGTTTTDANGFYVFDHLAPGVYGTREIVPAGDFADDDHVGSAGGTLNGLTEGNGATLTSGMAGTHYDYCVLLPVSISGYVHVDVNGDCDTDPNAPPLAGVTIQLLNAQSNVIGTTTTDANGFYIFAQLPPGSYSVREVVPKDYFADDDHVGSAGGTLNGLTEVDGAALTSGMAGTHYDFCVLLPVSISGYVHVDVNGDCDTDPNAPPLAGVTIQLLNVQGNVIGATVTDANGFYVFNQLPPGTYSVRELVPGGYYADDDHVGSAGGILNGLTEVDRAAMTSGMAGTHYDFCVQPPVSVAGFVKLEIYGDCETTPTDPPLAGVTIQLLDANGTVIGVTQTDAAGQYLFTRLPPGTYGVEEIIPPGYFYSDQHIGTAGGVIVDQGTTNSIVLGHGQIGVGYDFCLVPSSAISGYVFIDGPPIATANPATDLPSVLANLPNLRNGIRQAGDAPVPGVTLMLADATGAPLLDQAGNPIETTTDANGFYQFAGLPPGLYSVIKVHPGGYIDGINQAGTLGGLAISPTLIQVGVQSVGASASAALLQAVGPVNDAIARIPLTNGQISFNNNFSEITLTTASPPIPIPELVIPPDNAIPLGAFTPPNQPPAPPVAAPPASPFLSGSWGVSGVTWHLSVVDAGLPRTSLAVLRPAWQLAGMRADVAAWFGARLRHGVWKLHPPKGAHGEARHVVFGKLGGIPVTGDFNGDGVTDVGVYVAGEWFIDLNGNGIWDDADLWAKLGSVDDKPVTGDWDGDGKTDIGIFGPAWAGDPRAVAAEPGLPDPHNQPTGALKNVPPTPDHATLGNRQMKRTRDGSLRADLIDHVFHFGQAGDVPVTGDWTGTGIDTIGIFNGGQWILDVDGDGKRSEKDITLKLGQSGDKPVVGDFNGDGIDELGLYRDGHWHIDLNHDGALDDSDLHHELGGVGQSPVVGDWDGDGTDQIGVHQEQADTRGDI